MKTLVSRMLWFALIALLIAIVVLSFVPGLEWRFPIPAHVLGYGALTLIALLALVWDPVRGHRGLRVRAAAVVIVVLVAGMALEVGQALFSPTRDASLGDVADNLIGVGSGTALWAALRRGFAVD